METGETAGRGASRTAAAMTPPDAEPPTDADPSTDAGPSTDAAPEPPRDEQDRPDVPTSSSGTTSATVGEDEEAADEPDGSDDASSDRTSSDRTSSDRTSSDRTSSDRTSSDRTSSDARPSDDDGAASVSDPDGPTRTLAAGIDAPTTQVSPRPTPARGARRGPGSAPPGSTGRGLGPHPARSRRGPGPAAPPSGPLPAARDGADAPLPGTMLVERYRLVAEVGRDRRAGAELWKARDVMLERDVAVTLLVGDWQADARASSALSRATRSAHFEHPHVARVLDVVRPGATPMPSGVLGAAVAEWTPGRPLADLVAKGPLRPSAALRVVEPLAEAVAEAHRSGLVVGLDHPQRVRISTRGAARLAFPMPRSDAAVADDVRGLGALMYLLLTARWPASDSGRPPAGLTAAPRTASGAPVPARRLRDDLPVELAALVDRTLDTDGGIRTAAAVHRLIGQLRDGLEEEGALLPVLEEGEAVEGEPGEMWHPDDDPEPAPDPRRRRKLRISAAVLAVAVLVIVGFLAFQVVSLFTGGGSTAPPVVIPPAAAAPPAGAPPPTTSAAPTPVQLSSIAVYDPSGSPDNPSQVNRAVDNDPDTSWDTSEYRQQLPASKQGIGMMATFGAPSTVSAVTVASPSDGTRVEVRTAPTSDVPLSRTQVVGSGTVSGGQVRIPVQGAPPSSNLLVWITALGRADDGRYQSRLTEVVVDR